jgi:hypothetical protein
LGDPPLKADLYDVEQALPDLHGEAVLALFGLADVNPRTIKVALRRRARLKMEWRSSSCLRSGA